MNSSLNTLYNPDRGSFWNKWDLHLHTPSSFDYDDKSMTDETIVNRLIAEQVRVVAVTDHHTIDIARIKNMQRIGGGYLTILPGIELRSDQGGDPIHYISIFPEDADLDHIWTRMQGSLQLTPADVARNGGNEKVYVPLEDGARLTRELGGIISIHAGQKSNSIEGIKNKEQFQRRIKYDITKNWVDLMEIGQLKDIDTHIEVIFPSIGLEKPLIICSDNHDIKCYNKKAALWLKCDPTFRGLMMVLREPRTRVSIGDQPHDKLRVEQNPTKYVRSISFKRLPTAPAKEKWFSEEIVFNPGLVAIIGNKGSGKSALSDTIGLLGACRNSESFSFLNRRRFRHPSGGYADHFEATILWESGETLTKSLSAPVRQEDVERLKYLPQDHVETVCNELVGIGEGTFEQELKSVIFSHVPEATRLGQNTLDELVQFQTNEKQKRIDTLVKQLREVSRRRAVLEAQTDPVTKKEISEKVSQRRLELEAHDKVKPAFMQNPAADPAIRADTALLAEIAKAEDERKQALQRLDKAMESQRTSLRRLAVAERLLEKISNFCKDFDLFKTSLSQDATELALDSNTLVGLTTNTTPLQSITKDERALLEDTRKQLDSGNPSGLNASLELLTGKIKGLQSNLDAPNRAYQGYLKTLATWQEKRDKIVGHEGDLESLTGLQKRVQALDTLPKEIEVLRESQTSLALEIQHEKLAQIRIYRALYEPVQRFIDSHDLAKNKLKLEFRAQLFNTGFTERLLALLALNRRGSFMGVDEGRKRAEKLVESIDWENDASVRSFLNQVDQALHYDKRENPELPIQLQDQLLKGKKAEQVFDTIYDLDYVEPRYLLRWEGKDIAMLSPGERGTLLLVFYLLIDKSDTPLLIDQPEGNLDNHTVAKVLVDCIKEARRRRQVFIVTHNPNLAVVCDADQVIYASIDKLNGNLVRYVSGSLENPVISSHITDVLEGTKWAFGVRGDKYKVGETGL